MRTRVQIDFVFRGVHAFDSSRLVDFIDAGCRRLGLIGRIEGGARAVVTTMPRISHGMRVRLKQRKRGWPSGIGTVAGHPRHGTYTTRVEWPNGWAGSVRVEDLKAI